VWISQFSWARLNRRRSGKNFCHNSRYIILLILLIVTVVNISLISYTARNRFLWSKNAFLWTRKEFPWTRLLGLSSRPSTADTFEKVPFWWHNFFGTALQFSVSGQVSTFNLTDLTGLGDCWPLKICWELVLETVFWEASVLHWCSLPFVRLL